MFDHPEYSILQAGAAPEKSKAALILLHGRGGSAEGILSITRTFHHENVLYLAPHAPGQVWYPYSFLEPVERNEPWLSNSLRLISWLLDELSRLELPPSQVLLGGFSQGACLAVEYAARNPRRYGGVAVLSGGLIGARVDPGRYGGSLEKTPVFFGCSTEDPYIPEERVHASADVLRALDGDVSVDIVPNMGHTINQTELDWMDAILTSLAGERQ